MKILFAVRLFSGFRSSVANGIWNPRGAPAIFKLIEALDASDHEFRLVLTCKEALDDVETRDDRTIQLEGLNNDVNLLGGEMRIPAWTGRFRWYLSEWRQSRKLLAMARKIQPDLIYLDRGNLWSASLLARRSQAPVVYRVLGISPSMTHPFSGNRPQQLLHRHQLRAPFALVICSQDGSGGAYWLDRMLNPEVERIVLMNGVDLPDMNAPRPEIGQTTGPTKVLLVGRLDPLKGCLDFISAFIEAWRVAPNGLRAIIVGDGNQEAELRQRVSEAGAQEAITFTGSLSHDEVLAHYRRAEIYVSLNKMGNLSNANLEAMRSGCCMIVPGPQETLGIDLDTASIFPSQTLYRISSAGDVKGLTEALLKLHANPADRRARGRATLKIAEKLIPSWPSRINAELEMLEDLAKAAAEKPR